jgi:hypothetical protein
MKVVFILFAFFLSLMVNAQVVPNVPTHVQIFGNFMQVQVYNQTDNNLNCQGWITLFNSQNYRYGQFFYNQFIPAQSSGWRDYYLGPYANSFWVRVVNNTIMCRIN